MLSYYIKEIKKHEPLPKEEEVALMKKAKEGHKPSYDKIINSNLRFVFQVAKSYQNKGLSLEDLIAEGNLGLVKAFGRFDPAKGVKFISYAV
jgi:RNA polymerase primary sigma factor